MGSPLITACNVAATYVSKPPAVGDHCILSTSSNWCVNSVAATTDLGYCGKIVALSPDLKVATVKWYSMNKVFEATYSAACALGSYVVTDTGGKVKASGTAAAGLRLNICAALDHPSSGKVQFLVR